MLPDGLARLGNIVENCNTYQDLHAPPLLFQVSFRQDELRINGEVVMDLVWIMKCPVFHLVDTHSCYQNAAFITANTVDELWRLFVQTRTVLYCGFTDVLRVDREPSPMVVHSENLPPTARW